MIVSRFCLMSLFVTSVLTAGVLLAEHPVATATSSSVDFDLDVQPIFTRFGCNAGACHGKQRGQNGFQLSLLGFDADFDFDAG